MTEKSPQQSRIVYEFVSPDSVSVVDAEGELERAFDVLFDIVLKEIEEEALKKRRIPKQERVLSGARVSA